MAGTYNISLTRGDRYRKKFRLRLTTDPDTYMDLTGFTGRAQVRVEEDAPDPPEMAATVTFGSDATSWWVQIVFAEADTATLDLPTYVWDLELTDPTLGPFTYLKGAVNVTKDVSRA